MLQLGEKISTLPKHMMSEKKAIGKTPYLLNHNKKRRPSPPRKLIFGKNFKSTVLKNQAICDYQDD